MAMMACVQYNAAMWTIAPFKMPACMQGTQMGQLQATMQYSSVLYCIPRPENDANYFQYGSGFLDARVFVVQILYSTVL